MGEKALWPTVVVIGLVLAAIVALVLSGIDVVSLLAILGIIFTGTGSLVSVLLYGKVAKIEQNTNGAFTEQMTLFKEMSAQLRSSVPVEMATLKRDD